MVFCRFFISRSKTSSDEASSAGPISHSTEGRGWLMNEAARDTFGRTWCCKVWISHRELSIAFDRSGSRSSKSYGSEVSEVKFGLCIRCFRPGCLKTTPNCKVSQKNMKPKSILYLKIKFPTNIQMTTISVGGATSASLANRLAKAATIDSGRCVELKKMFDR